MQKMTVIGLSGKAGSGKDTVGQMLDYSHRFAALAFAGPLRDMILTLMRHAEPAGKKVSPRKWASDRALKESPHPVIGASYRQLAQSVAAHISEDMPFLADRAIINSGSLEELAQSVDDAHGCVQTDMQHAQFEMSTDWSAA